MVYVLPGMGADSGMYSGPWRSLSDCRFIDWPAYGSEESIREIAELVTKEARIPDGSVLVGSSLGGIVACEIAELRSLRSLILVGSAMNREEINRLLSLLHPLADVAPLAFIQISAGKLPNDVTRMFSRSQAPFIRAMCRAIFDWKGLDEAIVKPLRIHGKKDMVIPLP